MQKTTISDVAREANVSKATVSRVLNHAPNVSEDLRLRVVDTIKRLDYQPNRAARLLKKNLQDVIGYLIPDITDSIFGDVIRGAEDLAYANKIGILAYSTSDDLERQQMYLDYLQAEQVAGIVLVPAPGTNPQTLSDMQVNGISIVLLDRKIKGFDGDCVASDSFQGAYSGTQHLIDLGYKRIATISGSQNVSTGIARLAGYRVALTDSDLPINHEWIVTGSFDVNGGYDALRSLMELEQRPEAVFVANDAMMVGVLHALQDLNISVPDDLAIVAFDELRLASVLNPPLTTIEQSTHDLGQESFRLLLERINQPNDRASRLVNIPTRINIRQSCGS